MTGLQSRSSRGVTGVQSPCSRGVTGLSSGRRRRARPFRPRAPDLALRAAQATDRVRRDLGPAHAYELLHGEESEDFNYFMEEALES